jgi:hypothetical protein
MKTITSVILVLALAFGSGCARPDWIERTLVTVDVTGVWSGQSLRAVAAGGTFAELTLDLQQEGPKVKGVLRGLAPLSIGTSPVAGPVEGSVAGDVFTFRQTNGSMSGELRVRGDEMAGDVSSGRIFPMVLKRVDSCAPSSSPKP